MQEFMIALRSFRDILDFVQLAQSQPFPVLAGNASQQVSAKSHMAMCTLDFREPIPVQVCCAPEDFDAFRTAAARFLYP